MRARGAVTSARGHAADDHVLRLVLAADRSEEGLRADLAGLDGRDALLGSGQLMVAPLRTPYDLDAPIACDAQVAVYECVVDAALADGCAVLTLGRAVKRAGRPVVLRGATPWARRLWALIGLPDEPEVRWT